jgi:23S rRNA pseudouridine1911/1915/1917 synthase
MVGASDRGQGLVVPDELSGERADLIVAHLTGLSRAEVRRLIDDGAVVAGGAPVRGRDRLAAGTGVTVEHRPGDDSLAPESVPFAVRYDRAGVLVVDKPAGVVVHPGAGRRRGTLAAGLLHRFPDLAGVGPPDRAGLVHRLDRETSGLLLVARSDAILADLQDRLRRREVSRTYRALVRGGLEVPTGTIDAPIGRDSRRPTRMAIRTDGRPARSHYRRLASWGENSLVEVELETGRTHQIRVHLASIGHPVAGDATYGDRPSSGEPAIGRPWLHAWRLQFRHPADEVAETVCSPLPEELQAVLAELGAPGEGDVLGL